MHNRDLIVIGGSAGAIAPLRAILADLPADLPAVVLVVLHIPARGPALVRSLANAGPLAVHQAEDGLRLERGHVYVAVPDHHLIVFDGHITLGRGPRENMTRPAIDPLFRSAALHHGPRVVGVVLSGLLSDGAAGLDAIERCGGVALVQDPAEAEFPEMPTRARQATTAGLSLPAAAIAGTLSDLVRQPAGPRLTVPEELAFEVEVAAGGQAGTALLTRFADPVALSCPDCGGVLSKVRGGRPLRFRCQVGHAYGADALAHEQEDRVDEAMRVALRIIEERAELVSRMATDERRCGRAALAELHEARAREYRERANTIREAVLGALEGIKSTEPAAG
ncbi:chemotaxis protein CheB [Methylobacterium sp. NEAU 140]|uniref:chemotaxis protein CheB n=1 Tax=Methylobacterium sp. NEAU 140 TaxID=3064945 RepID=UPI002733C495|nr:chemotaxis protein CheB [Methylobacterium sp. NEAU 140]MDP4026760.1 chemotaxis protein CheB [Methylobacterium sp. NEAU 140]